MTDTISKKLLLHFPLCECEKPIIYNLIKDYDLMVNVFRAKVTPDEYGYLALDVTGSEDNINDAVAWVKTFGASVQDSTKGIIRDDDKCSHCGHCVTHCPTGALKIHDRTSRRVEYNMAECIECKVCIRVCPYDACSAGF